jgi:hypothetical protein
VAGESKNFFFEKKKQKTFANLASAFPERLGPRFKSFLVLFSKKELLPSSTRPPLPGDRRTRYGVAS